MPVCEKPESMEDSQKVTKKLIKTVRERIKVSKTLSQSLEQQRSSEEFIVYYWSNIK